MLSEILKANLRDMTPYWWVRCQKGELTGYDAVMVGTLPKFRSKSLQVFSARVEEDWRFFRLPSYTVSRDSLPVVLNKYKKV